MDSTDVDAGLRCAGEITSVDFYRACGASAIMRAANFPNDLLSFLQLESLIILQVITEQKCDLLIELGCYDGRALEIAKLAGIRYLGVDINAQAIETLEHRIIHEGLNGYAKSILADINDVTEWGASVEGKTPLYVVPFNLLGNLSDPHSLLQILNQRNSHGVLSVFNSNSWTTEVRRNYYTSCGIKLVGTDDAPFGGVRFRGHDGFVSQSFSQFGFELFLKECGVTTMFRRENRIGHCTAVKFSMSPAT